MAANLFNFGTREEEGIFMFRNVLAMGLLTSVSFVLAGCGGGSKDAPATVAAKGTITFKGNPVPRASVAFTPASGKVAMGETDDQGNFTLTTNEPGDGAVVGDYTVTLVPIPDEVPDMFAPPAPANPDASPFPPRYGDPKSSGLKATVSSDPSKNVFTFDLE